MWWLRPPDFEAAAVCYAIFPDSEFASIRNASGQEPQRTRKLNLLRTMPPEWSIKNDTVAPIATIRRSQCCEQLSTTWTVIDLWLSTYGAELIHSRPDAQMPCIFHTYLQYRMRSTFLRILRVQSASVWYDQITFKALYISRPSHRTSPHIVNAFAMPALQPFTVQRQGFVPP